VDIPRVLLILFGKKLSIACSDLLVVQNKDRLDVLILQLTLPLRDADLGTDDCDSVDVTGYATRDDSLACACA
jgi:hypothetical protein